VSRRDLLLLPALTVWRRPRRRQGQGPPGGPSQAPGQPWPQLRATRL